MKAMTIEEITTYYEALRDACRSNTKMAFANSDRCHNATIVRNMLDFGGHISMYCGEMSVFRRGFYNHIAKEHGSDVAKRLITDIRNSLANFLTNDNNSLDIVVASQDPDITKDIIASDTFGLGSMTGCINVSCVDRNLISVRIMPHFMLNDNHSMIRMEINNKSHSGIFVANADREMFGNLSDGISVILSSSSPIKIA